MPEVKVVIVDSISNINIDEQPVEVILGTSGPQGAQGTPGDPGGVQYEDLSYVHVQNAATDTWNIVHGLNFIPNITVVDSGGTVVEGSYNYPDANTVVLSFSNAFSGKAYLS